MITVQEAQSILSNVQIQWGVESIPLAEATGRYLAEEIKADRDYPPFNRAMMDGFAIRFSDWQKGQRTFSYSHQQWAGSPIIELPKDEACEITTGAAVPSGFDVVVPIEKVEVGDDGTFTCSEIEKLKSGWNIQKQGVENKENDVVVKKDTFISAAVIAVLASCGITMPLVYQRPTIAIISTGDELVPMDASPLPNQIRTSNAHALSALVQPLSRQIEIFHLNDDPLIIQDWMQQHALQWDILLFSGGVSKGGKDYLPQLWQEDGFECLFHGIAQKPGKPMWLGRKKQTILFGFPGNPVSTLVCAIAYLIPWIKLQWSNHRDSQHIQIQDAISTNEKLDLWIPVVLENNQFKTLNYLGSGDLIGFSALNGIIHVPSNQTFNNKNQEYRFYPITNF
jgi:molybdopterin molybdotransferase